MKIPTLKLYQSGIPLHMKDGVSAIWEAKGIK
jgi:hypothetical protein